MAAQDHMFTGRQYSDGTRVPQPVYRCKKHVDLGHPCKQVTDHEGDHKRICGKKRQQGVAVTS